MKNWIFQLIICLTTTTLSAQILLEEGFDSNSAPANWSSNSVTFTSNASGYANFTNLSATLTSPVINAESACSLEVSIEVAKFGSGGNGPLTLEVSIDNGVSWSTGVNTGTPTSSSYITSNFTLTTVSSQMRFRISRPNSTSQKRLGNFKITSLGDCGSTSTNTLEIDEIHETNYTISCTEGKVGLLSYLATGTFNNDNNFIVQLSDETGSFLSPTSIGSINSQALTSTIPFQIPPGLSSSSDYQIRIVSTSPTTISSSTPITITQSEGSCTPLEPHITNLLFNGCNSDSGCGEGQTEIVFFTTGSYSVSISNGNFNLNYGYNLLGNLVNAPSTTAQINAISNCGQLYKDAYATTLPAFSTVVFLSSATCVEQFDWQALCGYGPIYLVYGQSGTGGNTWRNGGNFGNSSGLKDFTLSVKTTDGSTFENTYSYNGLNTDGAYANFGSSPIAGHATSQGVFPNCSFTPIALSNDISPLNARSDGNAISLQWQTTAESAISTFFVYRSIDGLEWSNIAEQTPLGSTHSTTNYSIIDAQPLLGWNYYKLMIETEEGTTYETPITAAKRSILSIPYNSATKQFEFPTPTSFELYTTSGQLVTSQTDVSIYPFDGKGMYLLKDISTGETVKILL